jgi:hypothetical protein
MAELRRHQDRLKKWFEDRPARDETRRWGHKARPIKYCVLQDCVCAGWCEHLAALSNVVISNTILQTGVPYIDRNAAHYNHVHHTFAWAKHRLVVRHTDLDCSLSTAVAAYTSPWIFPGLRLRLEHRTADGEDVRPLESKRQDSCVRCLLSWDSSRWCTICGLSNFRMHLRDKSPKVISSRRANLDTAVCHH